MRTRRLARGGAAVVAALAVSLTSACGVVGGSEKMTIKAEFVDSAGLFVGNYHTVEPPRIWTLASAISVPVLNNANLVLQAKAW